MSEAASLKDFLLSLCEQEAKSVCVFAEDSPIKLSAHAETTS